MSWIIDSAHTRAEFAVKHMMIATVRGQFTDIQGTVDFDEQTPAKSKIDVKIGAASVNTREEKRDAHLKSPDFFDADKYPYLRFKSKKVQVASENTGRVIGDLTIRDVTHEIVLDVEYNGAQKSPWGTHNAGFSATAKINRKDWDLNWNVALETGGWLVGDEVKINIEAEIIKQVETQPEAEAVAA
jgi:polyisoprenoid-binding protein YceI